MCNQKTHGKKHLRAFSSGNRYAPISGRQANGDGTFKRPGARWVPTLRPRFSRPPSSEISGLLVAPGDAGSPMWWPNLVGWWKKRLLAYAMASGQGCFEQELASEALYNARLAQDIDAQDSHA